MAIFASLVVAHRNLGFRTENRLFEFQGYILAQIRTALSTAASPGTSAEKIAEAEKVAEDLADILKNCGIESARACIRSPPHVRSGHRPRACRHPPESRKPRCTL